MSVSSDFLVWGNNQSSLLSKSSSKCLANPMPLSLPFEIVSICASQKHISFVTKDGQLYSYGTNLDGRLGVSTKSVDKVPFTQPIKIQTNGRVVRVQSGFSHMCILTDKVELYAWGLGDYGALGIGQFKSKSVPTRVDLGRQIVGKLRQISCGAMHTAFLTDDGDVYTCGSNQYGQLGVNRLQKVSSPIPISFHLPVQQVSCGVFYTLLLTRDGKVYGMGNNKYGQLGTGHKVNQCHPTLIRQLNDIIKVTAGYHSGAIDKFGNLYIWGSGSFGQLLKPKKFVLSVPIKDIAIRGFFGVAIGHTSKNQNRIYSWGNNTFGELGLGNYEASSEPQQVQTLRGLEIYKVALGVNFAMVLLHPPSVQRSRRSMSKVQERQRSQRKTNREQQSYYGAGVSQRRSVKGFQQNYLQSDRGKSQDFYIKSQDNIFQGFRTEDKKGEEQKSAYRKLEPQQKSEYKQSHYNKDRKQKQQYSNRRLSFPATPVTPVEHRRNTFARNQDQDVVRRDVSNTRYQAGTQRAATSMSNYPGGQKKDYEKLFLRLSQDYQILVKRYTDLQRQIPQGKLHDDTIILLQQREKQLLIDNLALKDQISKLSCELIAANDQIRIRSRKNEQLLLQNQRLVFQHARTSSVTLSPAPHRMALSAQIQAEYNRLLTQKQQIISKLNISMAKAEQEYKIGLTRLTQENILLKNQLNGESQNNRKAISDHQILIDELQIQIKKSQQVCNLLKNENQTLKTQLNLVTAQKIQLQQAQFKQQQIQVNERNIKQKYEQDLRDSEIKSELMTGRIAQLEVQLEYEKQFNRKYQESISQIKQSNEKLHKQLNAQIDSNTQKSTRIQNLKAQVEKIKKYKRQLDEKNIQIQQFNQNMEELRKKSKQMLNQKQKEIKQIKQNLQKVTTQLQDKIQKRQLEIQDMNRQNIKLQKQINKAKESITSFKTQLTAKEDQLSHTQQQKSNMEKKVAMLSSQLKKQIDERETIVKDAGESKRQLAKLRVTISELQGRLQVQQQDKQKLAKGNSLKDDQIHQLKEEIERFNQKCENLKKQNTLYRSSVQQLTYQVESQQKMNQQLTKANREFAQGEQQFTQKISQLQNRIYELQDQNKSYTPRYDALLIRNKQLDERNRQLSQMINKAIQIQAQSYKNNILKEVQINTDNIINQFKQEQVFQFRGRRNKNKQKQVQKQLQEQQGSLTKRGEASSQFKGKQQPYTKMMKQRITQHKRKVSESAQKLANILDLNEKGGKSSSKGFTSDRHNTEDYEKINSQMESFNNQKEEFMSKIHSFAEKLKIL